MLTVAERFVGDGDVGKNVGIFRLQSQCCADVGESLFAIVACVKDAEHRMGFGVLRSNRDRCFEQFDGFLSHRHDVYVVLEPLVGNEKVGPNAPVFVVECECLAEDGNGLGVAIH